MMTHILVLQGAGEGAHEWDIPLIDALKHRLGNDYQIHYPKMPNEESPKYEAWADKIEQVLQSIPDPVIVLGHSLGGSVFLKYRTERKTNRKFPGIFLISSPFWGVQDWEDEKFQLAPGFENKLDGISQFFIYHSEEDPYVPFEHHKIYKNHLTSATIRVFDNVGHEMVLAVPVMVKDIRSLSKVS